MNEFSSFPQTATSHTFSRRREVVVQRVTHFWRQWRWFILFAMWLTGYILGCIGFHFFYPERRLADDFYLAFQLHSFNNSVFGDLPWQLDAARWLMPLAGSFALLEALGAIFRDRVREVRSRSSRNHVVICGLSQKGFRLARSFRDLGYRVLVIENNPSHALLAACEESGIFTLIGDATRRETLLAARVAHAKYLLAVSDDAINAAVVTHARDIASPSATSPSATSPTATNSIAPNRSHSVLICAAHVVDSELWRLLRRWEVSDNSAFRLQLFDVFDIGARGLLSVQPPFLAQPPWQNEEPHLPEDPKANLEANAPFPAPCLLVIGAGRLAQRIVICAARQWQEHQGRNQSEEAQSEEAQNEEAPRERLKIVLVDHDASSAREMLRQRHAGLFRSCEIEARDLQIGSTVFQNADLFDSAENHRLSAIYICLGDEAQGLSAALLLRHRLETRGWEKTVPMLIRTEENAGIADLLSARVVEQENRDASGNENKAPVSHEKNHELRAFGLLDYSCRLELVLGGTSEVLARTLHENYVQQNRLALNENNSALVLWDDLPEPVKEKNRRQADFIGTQLQLEGCDIAPISDWEAKPFDFFPAEIERMAQREHARWREEQQRDGWTHGARDDARKTNPNLLAWSDLPPDVQEMNRQTMRRLPEFLARAGFQVFRL